MKGSVEFDRIEKEFQYSRECMGMIKEREIFDAEELANAMQFHCIGNCVRLVKMCYETVGIIIDLL